MGDLCANSFDYVFIKEDKDLRGRKQNEVAEILYNSVCKYNKSDNIKIIIDELDALKQAVSVAEKDDLIVVFYENIDPLLAYLKSINAVDLIQPPDLVQSL